MPRAAFFLTLGCAVAMAEGPAPRPPPTPTARVAHPEVEEGSGLAASRAMPGRYWVVNDGGHAPAIYLMDAEGRDHGRVEIEGAPNRDWEALATDAKGGLWIADVGNNGNMRRDLALYRVPEPREPLPTSVAVDRKIRIRYPDQDDFPPAKRNFDCEAVFVHDGKLYLLTKHRADRDTKLYRLDPDPAADVQTLTLLGRAREVGQATGADLHPDGRRLAVLTFNGVWLFERPENGDNFLSGGKRVYLLGNWAIRQTEGIAWIDDDTLLLTNEQREIFQVSVTSFVEVE